MLNVPSCGEVEKIFQNAMAVMRGDALGMELHAVNRTLRVG
jgi:hypothetical protein